MSGRRSGRWLCLGASLGVLAAGAAGQCPPLATNTEPVGHILTVQGQWRLKTSPAAKLQPGCDLGPGAEILAPPRFAEGTAKLAVVDCTGNLRVRTCDANQDCGPSLVMPMSAPKAPGLWASLIREIMRTLRGAPDRYVSTISMDYGELNDAVVAASGTGVDVSPVMKGLPAADYELEFARVATVHWDGSAARLSAGALGSGLFQVRRKDQRAMEAWVLILPAGSVADDTMKRETELRNVMNGWTTANMEGPDTPGRNARRTLYRAFLASEAERAGAAH